MGFSAAFGSEMVVWVRGFRPGATDPRAGAQAEGVAGVGGGLWSVSRVVDTDAGSQRARELAPGKGGRQDASRALPPRSQSCQGPGASARAGEGYSTVKSTIASTPTPVLQSYCATGAREANEAKVFDSPTRGTSALHPPRVTWALLSGSGRRNGHQAEATRCPFQGRRLGGTSRTCLPVAVPLSPDCSGAPYRMPPG